MAKFSSLSLNPKTLAGLAKENYVEMTDIQVASIAEALATKDILGAAKTGSGKTLAFLIPVLEILSKENWSNIDGLGALIITPTRELALQIFETLRKIGHRHSFSAGLVIGGKKFNEEQEKITRMNIIIATPGRLLQHIDQTLGFDTNQLKILVLDEADRILDMGFSNTMNAILESLPKERQTLLFSATQSAAIQELARVSLKTPSYIKVHNSQQYATPDKLSQFYMVCPLPSKIDWLFSFLKSHRKAKIIVFATSCKQVRFLYEAFCKLQPGIPLMHLHGRQSQFNRFDIFHDFCRKETAALFATDIASRGLDFPSVDWVVQLDCPDSVDTYIHRVGRAARYEAFGNALLFLLPSEVPLMIKSLELQKIPITLIEPNYKKIVSVQSQLAATLSQYASIKYLAQKALVSYMRSIFLKGNKEIFDMHQMNKEEFAMSLGLLNAPILTFFKKSGRKNTNRDLLKIQAITEDEPCEVKKLAECLSACPLSTSQDNDDDELLRRKNSVSETVSQMIKEKFHPHAVQKKKRKKIAFGTTSNVRQIFDDENLLKPAYEFESEENWRRSNFQNSLDGHIAASRDEMKIVDENDKLLDKMKRKCRRLEKKKKLSAERHFDPRSSLLSNSKGSDSDSISEDYEDIPIKDELETGMGFTGRISINKTVNLQNMEQFALSLLKS